MTRGARARQVASFAAGLVFALGLGISGMTDPHKVLGFLDVGRLVRVGGPPWDPSLALVMVGAIGVHVFAVLWARHHARPVLAEGFAWPTLTRIDAKLLIGAAVFGAGWGLGGFCPGPALVALSTFAAPPVVFVLAMLAGMAIHRRLLAPRLAKVTR